ncbi:hypothetical protein AMECASPLE_039770 [Ameca splendens]|uniref:Uncharacterized protein n=1 Tax=Ameca splendens TaxID=208324 RepID=A0ABV0Z8N8_9TELE
MFPPTTDLTEEHQASSMDLFTFLSREAEKSLRRSAGLSVPQSAYDGSRLAIPVPGTGPLRRRSPPAPLVVHSGPAVRPTSSSRRKKRQRAGVPSRSAGEEVVSQPAYVRAASSEPASLSAIALSPRHLRPCRLRSLQPGVLGQHLPSRAGAALEVHCTPNKDPQDDWSPVFLS